MSHFATLLENALKAGNAHDPAYREAVYKGALRAFDKMSDQREDRAEFRKVHGPQLAEAITKIEERYVVVDDHDLPDDNGQHMNGTGEPVNNAGPEFSASRSMAGEKAGAYVRQAGSPSLAGTVEPPTADYDDFDFDEASEENTGIAALVRKFGLWLAAGGILIVLLLAIWLFI